MTTIRIQSDRYYLAEYQIAIWPTIRPRSEYEMNIGYTLAWRAVGCKVDSHYPNKVD